MEFHFDVTPYIKKPLSVLSYPSDIKIYESNKRKEVYLERMQEIIDEFGIASAKAQQLKSPITTLHKLKECTDHRIYFIRDQLKDEIGIGPDFYVHSDHLIKENIPKDETETTKRTDDIFHGNLEDLKKTTYHQAIDHEMSQRELQFRSIKLPVNIQKNSSLLPIERRRIHGFLKVGVKNLFISDDYGRQHEIKPLCVLDFYISENSQRKGYGKKLFDFMLTMEGVIPSKLAYDRPSNKLISFLRKHFGLAKFISQANNFVVFREYGLNYLSLNHGAKNFSYKYQQSIAFAQKKPQSSSMAVKGLHSSNISSSSPLNESYSIASSRRLQSESPSKSYTGLVDNSREEKKEQALQDRLDDTLAASNDQMKLPRIGKDTGIMGNQKKYRANNSMGVAASLNLPNYYSDLQKHLAN